MIRSWKQRTYLVRYEELVRASVKTLDYTINPVFANVYERELRVVSYTESTVLLPIMKERGQYTKEVMKRISEAQGSVQGEDWLDTHLKKLVFRTAFELNQETIMFMGSQRQRIMNSGLENST